MSLSDADVWHAIADGYTATAMHLLQPFSRAALDGVPLGPDSRVLDVACGPGTLTELVAPHVAHVLAVDFAPAMVRACRDRLASQTQVEVRRATGRTSACNPRSTPLSPCSDSCSSPTVPPAFAPCAVPCAPAVTWSSPAGSRSIAPPR